MIIHFATDDRYDVTPEQEEAVFRNEQEAAVEALFAWFDEADEHGIDAVQVRRAQIVAELEEYDDPSLMGRLACLDGKDGDRSNPFDRFDDLDSWDEFRRGYEAEQAAQA